MSHAAKTGALRALLARATPSPWAHQHYGPSDECVRDADGTPVAWCRANQPTPSADAALIAAAINALPALLDEIEALRGIGHDLDPPAPISTTGVALEALDRMTAQEELIDVGYAPRGEGTGASGWRRIGRYDSAKRRALWVRVTVARTDNVIDDANVRRIELCAGREGDDAYVRIESGAPGWSDLIDVVLRSIDAACPCDDQVVEEAATDLHDDSRRCGWGPTTKGGEL